MAIARWTLGQAERRREKGRLDVWVRLSEDDVRRGVVVSVTSPVGDKFNCSLTIERLAVWSFFARGEPKKVKRASREDFTLRAQSQLRASERGEDE